VNILFVLEHYYPYIGGVENLFTLLAETLTKQGHKVTVVTTKHSKELCNFENINGVSVVRLNLKNRFLFTFFGFWGIIKYAWHCDFIHTTSYNAAFPAFLTGLLTKKKVIITFHEYWNKLWFTLPFLKIHERILYWTYEQFITLLPFYRIIAVSKYTKLELSKRVKSSKIEIIYNGIDYPNCIMECEKNNKEFVYTFFGRLGVSKGLDLLLQSASMFQKKYPETIFQLIIPKKPKSLYLKILNLIETLGLNPYVKLYHELEKDELMCKIKKSNVVVIPSYSEGFCYAAVETIALGVPIISSDMGALKEVVSGKYIKLKSNTVNEMFQALCDAKDEKWVHEPIKKFELSTQITKTIEFYKTIL
jgi:glycosyltransferase involved in cell wall biosynthesis